MSKQCFVSNLFQGKEELNAFEIITKVQKTTGYDPDRAAAAIAKMVREGYVFTENDCATFKQKKHQ